MADGAVVVLAVAAAILGYAAGRWRRRVVETQRARHETAALRRRAEAAAHRADVAALRLAAVYDAIDVAVIVVDETLDVVDANAAARDAFGLAPDARPSLMAAIRSAELRAVIDDASRGNAERQPVRIGERLFAVRVVAAGAGERVVALADQTQLEYLERARRDLVANVSHDLRTPLTTLGLLLDALRDPRPPADPAGDAAPPTAAALLDEMGHQVERMRTLADDLLQLNQLESGRALFRLVPEPVDALVEAARRSVAHLMADADVRLGVAVPSDVIALADRSHIVRAIVNLLDNARRFSPPGTTVQVTAARMPAPAGDASGRGDGRDGDDSDGLAGPDSDMIRICVTDEGPGVPPRERLRIFERFYRGDRSRRGGGTGLGLAIAKHIVEGHGGRIWVEDAPGGGAAVCFSLVSAGAAVRQRPAGGGGDGGGDDGDSGGGDDGDEGAVTVSRSARPRRSVG